MNNSILKQFTNEADLRTDILTHEVYRAQKRFLESINGGWFEFLGAKLHSSERIESTWKPHPSSCKSKLDTDWFRNQFKLNHLMLTTDLKMTVHKCITFDPVTSGPRDSWEYHITQPEEAPDLVMEREAKLKKYSFVAALKKLSASQDKLNDDGAGLFMKIPGSSVWWRLLGDTFIRVEVDYDQDELTCADYLDEWIICTPAQANAVEGRTVVDVNL